jgi:fatty acid desaturase
MSRSIQDGAGPPAGDTDRRLGRGGTRSQFAVLLAEVRTAGLLERRPTSYIVRIGLLVALWVGGWAAFVAVGTSWWQLAVATGLAIVSTQVAFLGHDAGHRQVYATRRNNDLLGLLAANLVVGLSYGWWIDKHTRHHTHPNHIGADPDIESGAVSFTLGAASTRTGRVARWLTRHQAGLFFPMLLGEGISLRRASIAALWRRPPDRTRAVESMLLATHLCSYLAVVFLVLPPLQAIGFIALHQGVFGLYMGSTFAPNHKGMPQFGPGDAKPDYLRRQVLTSRNVRGGLGMAVLLGGLNYQIEHHLFPSMPSLNLRHARPLVLRFCRDHGVSYCETSLIGSYRQVLHYLHEVGAAAG